MTTNLHTAISVGAAANAATFNTPLGALDEAITNAQTGVYNVLEYGATGDGVTDDTTAIQAAVNAANSAGGGLILIPAGEYLITTTITCYSYLRFSGTVSGYRSQCDIIVGADNIAGFTIGSGVWSVYFENLTIRSDKTTTTDATNRTGVKFVGNYSGGSCQNFGFINVQFRNLNRGLWMYDNASPIVEYWMVDSCNFFRCRWDENIIGVEIDAGNATDINFYGCTFGMWPVTTSRAIYLKTVGTLAIYNASISTSSGTIVDWGVAIYVVLASHLLFDHVITEAVGQSMLLAPSADSGQVLDRTWSVRSCMLDGSRSGRA